MSGLEVAGLAAGVTSLGIQLYTSITTYLDALHHREDDLRSARARLKTLRKSIAVIDSWRLSNSPSLRLEADAIASAVAHCEVELVLLHDFVQKLLGVPPGSKVRDKAKKLVFPFHRPNLVILEERLGRANAALQTALDGLLVTNSLAMGDRISNIGTNQLPRIDSAVTQLSTDVRTVFVEIQAASTSIRTTETTLSTLSANFGTFAPEASIQLGDIQRSVRLLPQQSDIVSVVSATTRQGEHIQRLSTTTAQLATTAEENLAPMRQSLASMEQSLAVIERILGVDNEERPPPQVTLGRMLARPSQMREVYDLASSAQPSTSYTDLYGSSTGDSLDVSMMPRACHCPRQKTRRVTRRWFGPLRLGTETKSYKHIRGCKYFNIGTGESSRAFEIMVVGDGKILSWALRLSLSFTSGAGGNSIGPNITYRPIVNEKASPVFRVAHNLHCFAVFGLLHSADSSASRFLDLSLKAILRLYNEGRASPNDVNDRGESIMHVLASVFLFEMYSYEPTHWFLKALGAGTRKLIGSGVTADIVDFHGRTAAMSLVEQALAWPAPDIFHYLFQASPDLTFSEESISIELLLYNPRTHDIAYAEILHDGPLSASLLQGNLEAVQALAKNSWALLEMNTLGQTPLHLSTSHPEMFRLILCSLQLQQEVGDVLNRRDLGGYHVIDYALEHSAEQCRKGPNRTAGYSDCACTDVLDTLLSTDGCFEGWLSVDRDPRCSSLFKGSLCALRRVLTALRHRRIQLQALAQTLLGDHQADRFNFREDVILDHHAADVADELELGGFGVPEQLRVGFRDGSLYHALIDEWWCDYRLPKSHMAELLYDMGFRDLDQPDSYGLTPILEAVLNGYPSPSFMQWLIRHNAHYLVKLSKVDATERRFRGMRNAFTLNPALTAAHLVLSGPYMDHLWDYERPAFAGLVNTLSPVLASDGCRCSCAVGGCTPASLLFSKMWSFYSDADSCSGLEDAKLPDFCARAITNFFTESPVYLTTEVKLTALRTLTFCALGMRHTCCEGGRLKGFTSDEMEEIWSEDEQLWSHLEELLEAFAKSLPLVDDFNLFLTSEWAPRVTQVLRELEARKMTVEERAAAEAVGVVWYEEDDINDDGSSNDDEKTVDFWMRRLEEIMET